MPDEFLEEDDSNFVTRSTNQKDKKKQESRIVRILAYIALLSASMVFMTIIAYYVAKYATAQKYKEVASIAITKAPPPLATYSFRDDFIVNTSDVQGMHALRAKISLGYPTNKPALTQELTSRNDQIRNIINLLLMSKTKSELSSIESRIKLQEELKASVNHLLSSGKIQDVYFGSFIIN